MDADVSPQAVRSVLDAGGVEAERLTARLRDAAGPDGLAKGSRRVEGTRE